MDVSSSSDAGWRVLVNPIAYNGIVSFSTLVPQGDACTPSGQSRVYAIDYGAGTTVLTNSNGIANVPYMSLPGAIDDLRFIGDPPGPGSSTPELIAGTQAGAISQVPARLKSAIPTRLLNWREIPTVE